MQNDFPTILLSFLFGRRRQFLPHHRPTRVHNIVIVGLLSAEVDPLVVASPEEQTLFPGIVDGRVPERFPNPRPLNATIIRTRACPFAQILNTFQARLDVSKAAGVDDPTFRVQHRIRLTVSRIPKMHNDALLVRSGTDVPRFIHRLSRKLDFAERAEWPQHLRVIRPNPQRLIRSHATTKHIGRRGKAVRLMNKRHHGIHPKFVSKTSVLQKAVGPIDEATPEILDQSIHPMIPGRCRLKLERGRAHELLDRRFHATRCRHERGLPITPNDPGNRPTP